MRFSYTAEQEELRASLRRFLADRSPVTEVRRLMETAEGYDRQVWKQMAGQLGLQGLAIPEEYGGSGFGSVELGIVFEELGRALACVPYFATVALAANALLTSGDEAAKAEYLPGIADGSVVATVALPGGGLLAPLEGDGGVRASGGEGGARLSGAASFVVDGHVADLVLVAARDARGALGLYAVRGTAAGLSRRLLKTIDGTRKLAGLEFADTPARVVASGGRAESGLRRTLDLAVTALAAEQAGGAGRALEMAVAYLKVRRQFERPIGAFQALKHIAADLAVDAENARTAAFAAAIAADAGGEALPVAAAVAATYCAGAYTRVAAGNVQLHGGIGYTWEHDAHLYLKRAKTSQLLLGDPRTRREAAARLVVDPAERVPDTTALEWSEEDDAFRRELRTFLTATAKRLGKPPKDSAGRTAWQQAWQAALVDNGYAGPGWPKEYGGMDLPFQRQVIYQEETARARVPAPPATGVGIAGPTIITYGSPEQRERFLRPLLRADKVWAQGYSEPEAGSDLAALRTTARRDGDTYIVNGQKVWSSSADVADIAFTLVRTGSQASRQAGVTYLIIDLHSPGVTVRPLRDLTGGAAFCEIFFDDVRVPVADRIGEENGGWPLVRTSLGHERAAGALNQATFYRRIVDELIELARERGLAGDGSVRERLVDLDVRVRLMKGSAMRIVSDIITKGEPGPASSVSRLFNTLFEQDLHEFALDLLGPAGLLTAGEEGAVARGKWLFGYLRTRASTIGAGTSQIQRNTIAEQVLGLPHDPAMPARNVAPTG